MCGAAGNFDDDVFAYGFQDEGEPIGGGGGSYGLPYRALCPSGIENLLIAGMLAKATCEVTFRVR